MSCNRLVHSARPAPFWHRLRCPECRSARRADLVIDLGIACLRAEAEAADRLSQVLEAVGLDPRSHAAARARVWRLVRRIARVVTAAVGSLVVAFAAWLWWIDRDPAVPVPSPAMPRVNAATYFRDATTALKDGAGIDGALSSRPRPGVVGPVAPPAAPASTTQPPAPVPPRGASASRSGPKSPSEHVYTLAESAALVEANRPALATLREGLRYPYLEPPARSFSAMFPHYAGYRRLARLLAVEAQVEAERGDTSGAMGSCLDAVQMGAQVQRGGILIGKLVGIACETLGRDQAWELVAHLPGPEARRAAARLARLQEDRVPLADTLAEEKWLTVAGLQEAFRVRGWRWNGTLWTGGAEGTPAADALRFLVLLPYSKRHILDSYQATIDAQIDRARRPYAERSTVALKVPHDPISRVLFPVFSHADCVDTNDEAQNALLLAALALRAYRVDHGAYPPTLAALVPAYLPAVPADPFARAQAALRYVRLGGRYTLYSVGPDGVDDGGTPVASGHPGTSVAPDGLGDIVAGTDRAYHRAYD